MGAVCSSKKQADVVKETRPQNTSPQLPIKPHFTSAKEQQQCKNATETEPANLRSDSSRSESRAIPSREKSAPSLAIESISLSEVKPVADENEPQTDLSEVPHEGDTTSPTPKLTLQFPDCHTAASGPSHTGVQATPVDEAANTPRSEPSSSGNDTAQINISRLQSPEATLKVMGLGEQQQQQKQQQRDTRCTAPTSPATPTSTTNSAVHVDNGTAKSADVDGHCHKTPDKSGVGHVHEAGESPCKGRKHLSTPTQPDVWTRLASTPLKSKCVACRGVRPVVAVAHAVQRRASSQQPPGVHGLMHTGTCTPSKNQSAHRKPFR